MNENNYTHTRTQQSLYDWVANDGWSHFTTLAFAEKGDGGFVSIEHAQKVLNKFYAKVNAKGKCRIKCKR